MNRHSLFALCVSLLAGCSSLPKDAFVLTPSSTEDRQLESRVFATNDQSAVLKDGATILNNMGYKTDLLDADVGLVTATKHEDRSDTGAMIMTVLSAGLAPTGEQQYKATLTTTLSKDEGDSTIVRLTLQHLVFDSKGEASRVELIKDKDIYKLFYERLGASLFIEPDRL